MQHDMIRGARQTSEEMALGYLDTAEYGTLALIDADFEPYAVPLSFARIDKTIYFHGSLKAGHKWACLEHTNKACFSAVATTGLVPEKFTTAYESAICFGTLRDVVDTAEKEQGLSALLDKYSPAYLEEGQAYIARALDHTRVLALDIERITGKKHD